jgi:hypothetical protein
MIQTFTVGRRHVMGETKGNDKVANTTNDIPRPTKREPQKLIQAKVPMGLFRRVRALCNSFDSRHPVTMQSIIQWGLEEWERKIKGQKS